MARALATARSPAAKGSPAKSTTSRASHGDEFDDGGDATSSRAAPSFLQELSKSRLGNAWIVVRASLLRSLLRTSTGLEKEIKGCDTPALIELSSKHAACVMLLQEFNKCFAAASKETTPILLAGCVEPLASLEVFVREWVGKHSTMDSELFVLMIAARVWPASLLPDARLTVAFDILELSPCDPCALKTHFEAMIARGEAAYANKELSGHIFTESTFRQFLLDNLICKFVLKQFASYGMAGQTELACDSLLQHFNDMATILSSPIVHDIGCRSDMVIYLCVPLWSCATHAPLRQTSRRHQTSRTPWTRSGTRLPGTRSRRRSCSSPWAR